MDAAAEIAKKVNEILQKLQDGVQVLIDTINATLKLVPEVLSWIVDKVKTLWDKFVAKLKEFWDWFVDKLSYVGNPFMLAGAAGGWREVGGLVANQVREIDDSDLTVDDNWAGRGADQYRQSVPPQREAMGSIDDDYANNVASALNETAWAIGTFWTLVVTATVTAVIGCATATGEAISILLLPAAPPTAYAAVAFALLQVAGGTVNLYMKTSSAQDMLNKTYSGVQSWPAFVTG